MSQKETKPIEVFYSYSPEDEKLRDTLEKQLSTLKRQGKIVDYHHRMINAGTDWTSRTSEFLSVPLIASDSRNRR